MERSALNRPVAAATAALMLLALSAVAGDVSAAKPAKGKKKAPAAETAVKAPPLEVERIGDLALIPLNPGDFASRPLTERLLVWHLSEAAWAGDRINLDQNYRHNVAIRDLMAAIVEKEEALPKKLRPKMRDYLVRLWVHHGVHDGWTGRKFTPGFKPAELAKAAALARKAGAMICDSDDDCLPALLKGLDAPMFDADFEPLRTVKDPPEGEDILTASFNNLYEGVRVSDLEGFTERNPLNSKLVKRDGKLVELVYRAGGRVPELNAGGIPTGRMIDVAPGLYAAELSAAIRHLEAAIAYAPPAQKTALRWLIRYYRTGDPVDFRRYNIAWVGHDPTVETINGFIEVYADARGAKGSFEGVVAIVDTASTKVMHDLARNAAELEKHMPWLDAYKKVEFSAPVANAFTVITESGDGGPLSAVGINLPNAQEIRETYGHKNFLLTNVMEARRAAAGFKAIDELAWSKEEAKEARRCFEYTGTALVAMHEVTGHGSGRVSPKLKGDPSDHLKEYYSTLEEARADLVALWLAHDELVLSLGVLPDAGCADESLRAFARGFPMRLRTITEGDSIEEDHIRAESLIVRYAMNEGAVKVERRGGKIYLRVPDVAAMRVAVGKLLAELMRIKAEGDFDAIEELVDRYGSRLDTAWRDDAIRRAKKLKLPTVTAVLPAILEPVEKDGRIIDVTARMATRPEEVTAFALRGGARPR